MAALGVDAPARHTDVAEQKLKHGRRVDELHRVAVLGPTERVENRSRATRATRRANDFGRAFELLDGTATDLGHFLRGVARVVNLQ